MTTRGANDYGAINASSVIVSTPSFNSSVIITLGLSAVWGSEWSSEYLMSFSQINADNLKSIYRVLFFSSETNMENPELCHHIIIRLRFYKCPKCMVILYSKNYVPTYHTTLTRDSLDQFVNIYGDWPYILTNWCPKIR